MSNSGLSNTLAHAFASHVLRLLSFDLLMVRYRALKIHKMKDKYCKTKLITEILAVSCKLLLIIAMIIDNILMNKYMQLNYTMRSISKTNILTYIYNNGQTIISNANEPLKEKSGLWQSLVPLSNDLKTRLVISGHL